MLILPAEPLQPLAFWWFCNSKPFVAETQRTQEKASEMDSASPRRLLAVLRDSCGLAFRFGVDIEGVSARQAAFPNTGGAFLPQQRLYFSPEWQGQGAFRGVWGSGLQFEADSGALAG